MGRDFAIAARNLAALGPGCDVCLSRQENVRSTILKSHSSPSANSRAKIRAGRDERLNDLGGSMKRRALLGGAFAVAALTLTSGALAQQGPIKIGMSMAQTGGLAGGGKAS